MKNRTNWQSVAVAVMLGTLGVSSVARAQNSDYVWIESENTTGGNIKLNAWGGWGNDKFLSEKKWAQLNIDPEKIEAELPDGGGLLSYKFNLKTSGNYEIWDRIGFEFVRSPFEWRLDNGEWTTVSPDELTTDLQPIEFFAEIAWLKLGERNLNAGEHTLDIRLPKTKGADGKYQKVFYTSDAIVIYPGKFYPNSFHKPDENYQTAADEAAGKQVFQLPAAPAAAARSSVTLQGDWEVARNDEQNIKSVDTPIQDFPANPYWTAIAVPSDKNVSRPDLQFAHRLWYRTRVNVPADQIGRSFFLTFPMNSLNTTVYVNGTYCGFSDTPLTRADIDVTKGIKAGTNEIWVGIRDVWYGRTFNPKNPLNLRKQFNLPIKFFGDGFQALDYPIWNNAQSGLLEAPVLTAAGSTYASDVFVKPSVAKKQLAAEITLTNPSASAASGEVQWAAINDKTGQVEKTFAAKPFMVAAGATTKLQVAEAWENPTLWWPNEPNLYRLRTTVVVGGKAVDTQETSFGFREWGTRGTQFTLNGVNWQLWGDLTPLGASNPEEFIQTYRKTNQRTFRLMMPGQGPSWRYLGMPLPEALSFFDRNGVVVRRNGLVDGEAIGYAFSESDEDLRKLYGTEMKAKLMENWREQQLAQVRTERNHPSIQIWTIENEFAFINLINLLGNGPLMDEYEREISKISDAVMAEDPTRTVMTDGGGATKFQTLPVHGNHYVFSPSDTRYPDLAYEAYPEGGGRGRWVWDQKRPRFLGEDYFATGINPADYAQWGGEGAFLSKTAARPAGDFLHKMLTEGYRWAGQSAWQFWSGAGEVVNPWNSQAWRAVFVRQYDWSFGSGQKVKRTFGIFNDTQYPDPLTFTRTLRVGNKTAWTKTTVHSVAPGVHSKFDEVLNIPTVTSRQEGQLVLTLSAKGKEIFRDVKPLSILPVATLAASAVAKPAPKPAAKPAAKPAKRAFFSVQTRAHAQMSAGVTLNAKNLFVYDPKGSVVSFLRARKIGFTPLNSLATLPAAGRVLVIGPNALSVAESTSSALAAYASSGRSVIVLDQSNPLKYQALTAEIETATTSKSDFGQVLPAADGSIGFPEDLGHPLMRGLRTSDFVGWGDDNQVYRNAYVKPTRGARSLVQAGPRLANSALVEVPTGKGIMVLSQLTVGEKLNDNAVAQQLLVNMLNYGATYKQEFRNTAIAAGSNEQLLKAADATGLQYSKATDALTAISQPNTKLAVVEATSANLKQLVANKTKLDAFMQRGGYVVFHGLAADGLEDYNKLVGFNHMIRPMRRERVTFPAQRSPLTAGLTLGDVVMLSGERIFGWTADEYVADDIFSAIVDYDEVAPFGTSDSFLYNNAVNGFYQADGWKLINNFEAPKEGPQNIKITLPKPQTITEFTWVGNTLYNPQTKVGLLVDGKSQAWNVQPNAEPQTLEVKPALSGKDVTVQILGWQDLPGKNQTIGIDNVYLKAARPADFYQKVKPMLNVGGLMHYPRGNGGMVLMNLNFKDNEAVPVNATKKRTIFSTVLRNLKAPFAGGKTVIAGAGLKYTPINFGDFKEKLNQYRTDRGWFGDKNFTFNALPTGNNQKFANVTYNIWDFATSPVPTAIMLGGDGVPNNPPQEVRDIPINRKADALFFLHTARIDQRRNEGEVRENRKYELARYVINYADGKQELVPIYSEIDIDDYKQASPRAIPGAQLAWVSKYAGTEFSAVAYSKQWNNPRPDVAIKSIDFTYGNDRRGVPVLLAITAANAQ